MENFDSTVFPGASVDPADSRYPTLVRGFNQRWVGQPQFVKVLGPDEDLAALVTEYVAQGLRITVRGGGHCYENFVSGNDNGVIIDLSSLNRVYQSEGMYVVEGGCTLWNVYGQLYQQYNVTIPGGSCYSVGAGGHITGGGYGLLSRLHGLTVDWLSGVECVVVDGNGQARTVQAYKDSDEAELRDLFWGHTGGGGGNYGIVTKFFFRDLPSAPAEALLATVAWDWTSPDYPGDHLLPYNQFEQLLNSYAAFFLDHDDPGSPYDGLFALLHLNHVSSGQITMTVQYVKSNPTESTNESKAILQDFLETMNPEGLNMTVAFAKTGYHGFLPGTTEIQQMPWLEATQTLNGSGPNRRGKYKSSYMNNGFPPEQIEALYSFLSGTSEEQITVPNTQALVQVDSYGAQINTIESDATAIPQRNSILKLQYQIYWDLPGPDGSYDESNVAWMQALYNAVYGPAGPVPDLNTPPADRIVDGCYINYPDVDLIDWQLLYYEENYPRLQQVKAEWDPLNIFNHCQSIELPA